MDGLPNNIPIQCRCCGFSFRLHASKRPISVLCPSCGNAFVLEDSASTVASHASEVPGKKKNVERTEMSDYSSGRSKGRWEILFLAVCLQLTVLVVFPLYLYYQSKTVSNIGKTEIENKEDDRQHLGNPNGLSGTLVHPMNPPSVAATVQPAITQEKKPTPVADPAKTPEKKPTPTAEPAKKPEKKPAPTAESAKKPEKKPAPTAESAKKPETEPTPAVESVRKPEKEPTPTVDTPKTPEKNPEIQETPGQNPFVEIGLPPSEELQSVFDMFSNRPTATKVENASPLPKVGHVPSSYEMELKNARSKLDSAVAMLSIDPEKSLGESIESVKMHEKLGQSVPSIAYWIIAQSYATQCWGEMLIEGSRPIENMAVSSDSRWLLTRCRDNAIWIWDIFRTQNTIEGFKLDSGENTFVKLLFTPDFRLAVGGETNGTIRIWDTTRKGPADSVVTLPTKIPGLCDMQISPDGRWLVAYGGQDFQAVSRPELETIPIQTTAPPAIQENKSRFSAFPSPVPTGTGPTESVSSAASSPEPGQIILVNYRNKSNGAGDVSVPRDDSNVLWLWDLNLLQNGVVPQPILLRGHEKPVRIMQISADSKWLVTGSDDTTARVYNLKGAYPGADQAVLKGHQLGITAIAIAPNGSWIATGSRDNTIRLWALPDTQVVSGSAVLSGHLGWISTLAVDANGERLVSGSYDQTVRIWKIPGGRVDQASQRNCDVIESDQGAVHQVLLSQDGKMLISLGGDAGLRIRGLENDFDPRHSVLIRNRSLPISKIALTPDNRWLIFSYTNLRDLSNCGVRLWPIRLNDLVESASEFGN